MKHIDYSKKIPDLIFKYDDFYQPRDLPDPQIDPVIPGARVPLDKVGIGPVDLPISVMRRDGSTQLLQSQASLYCSLNDPQAKGLNLSRLYLIMHDAIKDHTTHEGLKEVLKNLAAQQASSTSYCKLRFKYPWFQESLRSDISGHIAYDVEVEGRFHHGEYHFYLTVDYVYSSTCPCSFELAHHATKLRGVAANAHSQRSIAKVKVKYDPDNIVWIEDVVELCRENIPTEVQIVVKRKDEQAFAELNGSNLLFSEDACRILYAALDKWYDTQKISDFSIVVEHMESLHPWNARAIVSKIPINNVVNASLR